VLLKLGASQPPLRREAPAPHKQTTVRAAPPVLSRGLKPAYPPATHRTDTCWVLTPVRDRLTPQKTAHYNRDPRRSRRGFHQGS